ncbi:MAG: DegT/DnrJ/EryC1/StrS family aminotransferase, partial [Bacteroidota bacterium]
MTFAERHQLKVIEDNAQSIGADYSFSNGQQQKSGTIGHIGCTSFYPSKNLGCYGDGGAIMTKDAALADKIRMVANHGQVRRYYHDIVGVNSRLDSIQAAILHIKLQHLDAYIAARQAAADFYDAAFAKCNDVVTPRRATNSTHVFHQYTLRVKNGQRDALKTHLSERGIPSMIYYPLPVYKQKAYDGYGASALLITESLCDEVLSLPMHTELEEEQLAYITQSVIQFFEQ